MCGRVRVKTKVKNVERDRAVGFRGFEPRAMNAGALVQRLGRCRAALTQKMASTLD